jgi:genome maintenance exonuclease 1
VKFPYPELTTTSYRGQRWYDTPVGHYPSITTILGATEPPEKKASLQRWQESLGVSKAAAVTKAAADRGTNVHLLCERYLQGEAVDAPINGQPVPYADMASFNALKLKLKSVNEVWGQEVALYSSVLELAGRCDLIGVYKGRPAIIDFKTSTRVKQHKDIEAYKLQLCFYGTAHNEMFGTDIDEGVILMVADTGFPMEFNVKLSEHLPELQKRAQKFWQDAMDAINSAD